MPRLIISASPDGMEGYSGFTSRVSFMLQDTHQTIILTEQSGEASQRTASSSRQTTGTDSIATAQFTGEYGFPSVSPVNVLGHIKHVYKDALCQRSDYCKYNGRYE